MVTQHGNPSTNKWVLKMHEKGWHAYKVAERWNMSRRNLAYRVNKPPGWLKDAIAGLPNKHTDE